MTQRRSEGVAAAVDLGASSGRVMIGRVGPDQLSVEAVHRFPNHSVRTLDGLHWDVLELYRQVLHGLGEAGRGGERPTSIGIDSWAVDYGLVADGRLVGNPYSYRDDRVSRGVELVHDVIDQKALYAANGLQFLPFNTLYQLAVDRSLGSLTPGTSMLLMPDLLGFWLTGEQVAESTNASTTGLLDVRTGGWNAELVHELGLPPGLLPRLVQPGTPVGRLRDAVVSEIGATEPIEVVAVGSHDTASAVVAVPMTGDDAAYISSGTWSLVGVELDRPVLSEASREANFTNEGGVDGRVRYLHNVMGLWLLSESVRSWQRGGHQVPLTTLLEQAAEVTGPVSVFDVNHSRLLAPADMPREIAALCRDTDRPAPESPAEFVRSILESLAAAYADDIDQAERLSGKTIRTVHIVGGGSQNALLCQLTADRSGRTVLAGPVEATAIGNVLIQARTAGWVTGELSDLRGLVARTFIPTEYRPR